MNLSFQRLLLVVPFVLVVLAKQSGADTQLAQSSVATGQQTTPSSASPNGSQILDSSLVPSQITGSPPPLIVGQTKGSNASSNGSSLAIGSANPNMTAPSGSRVGSGMSLTSSNPIGLLFLTAALVFCLDLSFL